MSGYVVLWKGSQPMMPLGERSFLNVVDDKYLVFRRRRDAVAAVTRTMAFWIGDGEADKRDTYTIVKVPRVTPKGETS